MLSINVQVRPSDCDSYGHVNNAVYLGYLEQALAEGLTGCGFGPDWQAGSDYFWEPTAMSIEYRQAALLGDRLTAGIWLVELDESEATFGFELLRMDAETDELAETSLVRAHSTWRRVTWETGCAGALPQELEDLCAGQGGTELRPFKLPADEPDARKYHWPSQEAPPHKVMLSELNPFDRVHPLAIYHWLQEAVFEASAEAGWPQSRWLEAGLLTLQTRHDTTILAMPRGGDAIRVTSRLIEVRRLRGTWLQEVHRRSDDQLLIRNYSTGVFLNLEGRPAAPPKQMMDDLRFS